MCTALSVALFAYGGSNVPPRCQNSGAKTHEGSAGLKTSTKEECQVYNRISGETAIEKLYFASEANLLFTCKV